jgi:hypothetical protein
MGNRTVHIYLSNRSEPVQITHVDAEAWQLILKAKREKDIFHAVGIHAEHVLDMAFVTHIEAFQY